MTPIVGALLIVSPAGFAEAHPRGLEGSAAIVLDLRPSGDTTDGWRDAAAAAAGDGVPGPASLHVLVPGPVNPQAAEILSACAGPNLAAIAFEANEPQDVRSLDVLLRRAELEASLAPGLIAMIPWLGSARAVSRAAEIGAASTRVTGLCLDGVSYARDLGLQRTNDGTELVYARSFVSQCARLVQASGIDGPSVSNDQARDWLARDAANARVLGLRAKYCHAVADAALIASALS